VRRRGWNIFRTRREIGRGMDAQAGARMFTAPLLLPDKFFGRCTDARAKARIFSAPLLLPDTASRHYVISSPCCKNHPWKCSNARPHSLQISASFIVTLSCLSQLRAVMILSALVGRCRYPAATLFSFVLGGSLALWSFEGFSI